MVDDHSDPPVDFDQAPGLERGDVRWLHAARRYQGAARNDGIDAVQGKWLLFADQDDFFSPLLPQLLDEFVNDEADSVFFSCNSLDSDTLRPVNRHVDINANIDLFLAGSRNGEDNLRYLNPECWGRMIRRQCVIEAGVRFGERMLCEDNPFSYHLGDAAKLIKADRRVAYIVTESDSHSALAFGGGLDGSARSLEAHTVIVEEYAAQSAFLRSRGLELTHPMEGIYKRQLADLIVYRSEQGKSALECVRNNGITGWQLWRRLWRYCLKRYWRRLFGRG